MDFQFDDIPIWVWIGVAGLGIFLFLRPSSAPPQDQTIEITGKAPPEWQTPPAPAPPPDPSLDVNGKLADRLDDQGVLLQQIADANARLFEALTNWTTGNRPQPQPIDWAPVEPPLRPEILLPLPTPPPASPLQPALPIPEVPANPPPASRPAEPAPRYPGYPPGWAYNCALAINKHRLVRRTEDFANQTSLIAVRSTIQHAVAGGPVSGQAILSYSDLDERAFPANWAKLNQTRAINGLRPLTQAEILDMREQMYQLSGPKGVEGMWGDIERCRAYAKALHARWNVGYQCP